VFAILIHPITHVRNRISAFKDRDQWLLGEFGSKASRDEIRALTRKAGTCSRCSSQTG